MNDPSVYFLTEEQLRTHLEEQVCEFVFGGYEPQETPALVLLGGQPAAGKSQAMAATVRRHGGTLVPLTGDEVRPLHPRYHMLQGEDAQTREMATAQFSGSMVRMSIEHALEHNYGLLLEGVFRDPAITIGTAERFAAAGRPVGVVALAVRQERSRIDALVRFLEGGEGGRWTPPERQDLAYGKVPETVAVAEQSPAVTSIIITNRSADNLYTNERGLDGLWPGGPSAGSRASQADARAGSRVLTRDLPHGPGRDGRTERDDRQEPRRPAPARPGRRDRRGHGLARPPQSGTPAV
ncbi:zeta toxin family protein [Streptomyces sp. NPDC058052]|uniref:zeta toxin family protein n=1 Tax=Streptomyces sp. NPDC058052 TaxID=3346316 RepID=UPI0036E17741